MKRFIDDKGTFEIFIPVNWKYSLRDNKVHTFQYYVKNQNYDTFQLSLMDFDKKRFKELINKSKYKIFKDIKYYDVSSYFSSEKNLIALISKHENKSVFFTFLLNNFLPSDEFLEKKELVFKILSRFRLINPENSQKEYESYLFEKFIDGVGASAILLNNAIENDCFIETIAILANQIDALLRTAIVLKLQLQNNNICIERKYIYQGISDTIITEKEIYKECKELEIISDNIFKELYSLYELRNKVVHRFIISELNVADIDEIAFKYYTLRETISNIVKNIEEDQINKNVGMTKRIAEGVIDLSDIIKSKFGSMEYTKNLND